MVTRANWDKGQMNFLDDVHNPTFRTGLWADCPWLAAMHDPSIGYGVFEDFTNIDAATLAGYTATPQASGTFTLGTAVGGTGILDSGANTQHQGINVQKLGPCFLPAAGLDIWFECLLSTTFPGFLEFFAGLADVDTTLMPTGNLDFGNSEYIGFGIETTLAGVMSFYASDAGAELNDSLGAVGTLVTGTQMKMGFKVTGITGIQCWINDVEIALTNVVAAGIPVIDVLTPTFVCQTDGTSQPIVSLDWYKAFQLR